MKCIIKTLFRHWATSACPEVLSPSYRWPSPSEVPPGNLWRPASVIRRVTHLPAAGSRHPRVEWAPRRPWRFSPPHRLQRVRSKECALFSPPCRQRDGPKKKNHLPKFIICLVTIQPEPRPAATCHRSSVLFTHIWRTNSNSLFSRDFHLASRLNLLFVQTPDP